MWPKALYDGMFGCVRSQVLYACHTLGLFQYLITHPSEPVQTIADHLGCDASFLGRLVAAACTMGLLSQDDRGYRVPCDLLRYLDQRSQDYCGDFILHLAHSTYAKLAHLPNVVCVGPEATADQSAPFASIYADKCATEAFLGAMWNLGFAAAQEHVAQLDLGSYHHLIDVGGASGSFSVAALQRAPGLVATIFDLPPVERYISQVGARYGLADRLHFVPGDFWSDELPAGDVYVFGYILSDWTDEECVFLLQKARVQLDGRRGLIVVLEKLYEENPCDGPEATAVADITMMVETRGRHRTASKYKEMLAAAGVADCEVHYSNGDKHMIVGAT